MKNIVNNNLNDGETRIVHCFESAGLGTAPFRFTGEVRELVHIVPGCAPKAAGTCDYCGTCIRYAFMVQASGGEQFKVGCDCIRKTGDSALIRQISQAERDLRDKKNKAAKDRKAERESAFISATLPRLGEVRGVLSELPHPSTYFAAEGKSMLDYVEWLLSSPPNHSMQLKAARYIGLNLKAGG